MEFNAAGTQDHILAQGQLLLDTATGSPIVIIKHLGMLQKGILRDHALDGRDVHKVIINTIASPGRMARVVWDTDTEMSSIFSS